MAIDDENDAEASFDQLGCDKSIESASSTA